jgi:hypothetical protein
VRGTPLSRITSRGRVGGDYFERMGMVRGSATGTVDRIEDMRNARFETCDPEIARFFERVGEYRIAIVPRWRFPFGIGARAWRVIARRLGQLALPVAPGAVKSRVVGLDAARDGRAAPRAWIREDADGGAMFVSAYATTGHYMNIGFPLPGMQMTSINRFVSTAGGGVLVTSAKDGAGCDCGCWLVIAGVPIRLPFREEIRLWTPRMAELPADLRVPADAALVGRQHLRLAGLRFLSIDYAIARQPDEARVDVARDPAPPQA